MKREPVTAPSGKVYEWAQPPRRVHWRHGRAGRTFAARIEEVTGHEGMPAEERDLLLLESMTDGELAALEAYADDVITAGLGHPPGNMPGDDYWFFFARSVYGVKEMKVETTEGETTVETVETFRKKLGLPSDGEDVPDVRPEPGTQAGDTGPAAG